MAARVTSKKFAFISFNLVSLIFTRTRALHYIKDGFLKCCAEFCSTSKCKNVHVKCIKEGRFRLLAPRRSNTTFSCGCPIPFQRQTIYSSVWFSLSLASLVAKIRWCWRKCILWIKTLKKYMSCTTMFCVLTTSWFSEAWSLQSPLPHRTTLLPLILYS